MTPDEMDAVLAHHAAVEHAFDFDATMRTMPHDCYQEHVGLGLRYEGQPACRRYYEELFGAFPDWSGSSVGRAYGEDTVAVWGRLGLTMLGPWLGFAPTGRTADVALFGVFRFRDGLLVGEQLMYDSADFADQLGLPLTNLRRAAARASQGH